MQIYYFTAKFCGPCRKIKPIVESMVTEFPIRIVDIEEEPELAQKYVVTSVPRFVFEENDEISKQIIGFRSETELRAEFTDFTSK